MKHKTMLLIFAGLSIVLISLGFLIDNDEPYNNIWQTIFEFSWLTVFLFVLQSTLYFLGFGLYKLAGRLGLK